MFEQIEEPTLADTGSSLVLAFFLVAVFGAFMALVLWLTQPDEVIILNSLKNQGYTQVHLTGRRFTGCIGEVSGEGFMAIHPSGHPVTGVVCMGSGSTTTHID